MTPFEESLRRSLDAAASTGPAWLRAARERAAASFRARGLPRAKEEDWRFTSLAALAPVAIAAPAPAGRAAALVAAAGIPADEPRLVLVDGRLDEALSSRAGLPAGAVAAAFGRDGAEPPAAVRERLGATARDDANPFVALNAALMEEGLYLEVPAGADPGKPIHLVFVTDAAGPAMSHPRVLVVAGARARLVLAEHWLGPARGPYVANGVAELHLGDGAQVDHYTLQAHGAEAFHFGALFAEQGAGARLRLHAVGVGARLARSTLHARLAGEGAKLELGGLAMLGGEQLSDFHSVVEHAVPGCETTESYKAILDGRSRGVFAGRIRVLPGAQKTQAYQQSSSLLLTEDAVIDTMPQLEIFADDVKCGHGGAVGQLDAGALFYLRSRGIDEPSARALLIYAFAAEMLERVEPPALRARAVALVAGRLPGGAALLEAA
jgi:Fe-S cluster assembly protein SufD